MYLSAGVKVGDYVYLIECLSRCLLSIYLPSGEAKIETYLPWKFTEDKICMRSFNYEIIIYSPAIDHFLIYDCLQHQITVVELQGIEADKVGAYCSNVLMIQDDVIVLPFKGKEIKRYERNGKLKFKDSQWCLDVSKECGCSEKLFGNIRIDSACVAGNQLFFSLIYGEQNYLCRYGLNQNECLCNIVYCSEDVAIRGVYAYSNMILFRRIFSDKTEIVSIALDSGEQKTIMIDYPTMFEEDIYGEIHHLRASFKNKIFAIEGNDVEECLKIYNFEQQDIYVANGILFNTLKNEILIPDIDGIKKYSIEKIVKEIKNSFFYQEGCGIFGVNKNVYEMRYNLRNLIGCLTEPSFVMIDRKNLIEDENIGKLVWRTI